MTTITTLPACKAKALLHIAPDKQNDRVYARSVWLDPAGYAVSTNGAAMLVIRTHQPFSGHGIAVPRVILADAVRRAKAKASIVISRDPHTQQCTLDGIPFSPLTDPYPDWRAVVPRNLSGVPAWYDSRLLEQFRRAFEDMRSRRFERAYITVTMNGDRAGIIQAPSCVEDCDDVLGVIMPMRTHADISATETHVLAFLSAQPLAA